MADLQLLQANKDAATLEAIASEAEQGAEVLFLEKVPSFQYRCGQALSSQAQSFSPQRDSGFGVGTDHACPARRRFQIPNRQRP